MAKIRGGLITGACSFTWSSGCAGPSGATLSPAAMTASAFTKSWPRSITVLLGRRAPGRTAPSAAENETSFIVPSWGFGNDRRGLGRGPAAVDGEERAGNKGRLVRGKIANHRSNFCGVAEAADGLTRTKLGAGFFLVVFVKLFEIALDN